jgi:MFS family permease
MTMKKIDYKWTALFLLWIACFLQQGMRQIFPPLASTIGGEFGADAAFRGLVMGVFTLVYALSVPFSGMAGDFLSRKKIVVFSLAVFSLGVLGAGWAGGILGIMLLYGGVNGFGQSFFYPATTSLVQQLHSDNKATALSILQLAIYLGIITFSFASGKMLDVCGDWRVPFKVFGLVGVLWASALVFLLRNTPLAVSSGVKPEKPQFSQALKAVFSKPSVVLLALGLGMQIFVDVGFKMWMPTYLEESFPGMSKAACGLNAVLWHYLGAFAGVMMASRISDRIVRRRPGIRMEMNITGLLLGAPFILWMARAGSFEAVCWGMGLFGLFRGVYDSNQFASIFDVVEPRYRASAMGMVLLFAFAFGAVAPVVMGLVKNSLGLSLGMASLAIFFVVGAIIILVARIFFLKRDLVS